ncbi:hypothetical protein CA850_23090 [Micromonospora echinospora]|nr:hypothetical protein CA850_23090 [Micromonospora echinospora]
MRLLTAVLPPLPIFVKAALAATTFASTILSVVVPAVTGLIDFAAGWSRPYGTQRCEQARSRLHGRDPGRCGRQR